MRNPRVQQVIITEQELRGNGTEADPFRRVLQVFTLDGELIAEDDPYPFTKSNRDSRTAHERVG